MLRDLLGVFREAKGLENERLEMKQMFFQDVQMNNGKIFSGERIGELVREIIDRFSEERLTCDEAEIGLNSTQSVLGEFSMVQKTY